MEQETNVARTLLTFVDDFVVTSATLIGYCPCLTQYYRGKDVLFVDKSVFHLGERRVVSSPLAFSMIPGNLNYRYTSTESSPDGWMYVPPKAEKTLPYFGYEKRARVGMFLGRVRVTPASHVCSVLVAVRTLEPLGEVYFQTPRDLETENCKVVAGEKIAVLCTKFTIKGVPYTLLYALELTADMVWPESEPCLILAAGGQVIYVEKESFVVGDLCTFSLTHEGKGLYRMVSAVKENRVRDVRPMIGDVLDFNTLRGKFWQTFYAISCGTSEVKEGSGLARDK